MATFTQGDLEPPLSGTVNAVLTGATVQLHIKRPSLPVLTVTATVTDAVAGTWTYPWADGDLAEAGTWRVEGQVMYSSGRPQTFGPASFTVKPQIA